MNDKIAYSRTPQTAELLQAAVKQGLIAVHTCLPGIVDKYDAKKQTADIVPAIKKPFLETPW